MKQLSGQDASFLYLETEGAHLNLSALYVYEQPGAPHAPLGYEDVLRQVESQLPATPVFRQKLVRPPLDIDFPYWAEDEEFDLESHIQRYEGPAPLDFRELFEAMAAIHAEPMDFSRPPWEMHVFERLGPLEGLPTNCFAIVAKYHHAAIDGASGMQLVDRLHAAGPAGESVPPARRPGNFNVLARAAVSNIRRPFQMIRSLAGAAPAMARSALKAANPEAGKPDPVPRTRFNGAISPKRVFHAISFKLDELSGIRNAVPGATVNDVILAICGGGLRTWLEELDELPDSSLVAMVPVNARPPGRAASAGNQLSTMLIPIHTDIADPLDRLGAIHRATLRAKAPGSGVSPRGISEITNLIPAQTLSATGRLITSLGLGRRLLRLANCTITNIPGSKSALYLGEARMVFTTGAAPIIDGMGLIISVFGYRDELTFSFTSCPDMLPDPGLLAEHTAEAHRRLLADGG